ncbi:GNAT family N-acetyltransferase [Kurthia sp. Dielmo]|uniref:GNAT family N-acetyltransferase n=1 Tax=Kurthia sp. Dielmo TaxID=1033738 RepID=UPI001644460E|nr:GNAT family N-acetyltransferase [Kurthia sp. Dielmo]
MFNYHLTASEALPIMLAAFERYKEDTQPSSALKETVESLEQELENGVYCIGYQLEEELVAMSKYKWMPNALYFSRLSVLPSYQRRGIASKLVDELARMALAQHKAFLQCKVRKSEAGNIALYTKLGFTITTEELYTNLNGEVMAIVSMEKIIQ